MILCLGFLPPQNYYQVLSSTDLLVFPSETKAFPMVCLETMALGKPIVATKRGGIPEIVKNMRNGILVNRDPNSIADAVVYLFKNKDLYEKISQSNLKSVRSFDWNNIINEYIELYKTLILSLTRKIISLQTLYITICLLRYYLTMMCARA